MNHRHQHFDWRDVSVPYKEAVKRAKRDRRDAQRARKSISHTALRLIALAIAWGGFILSLALIWIESQ